MSQSVPPRMSHNTTLRSASVARTHHARPSSASGRGRSAVNPLRSVRARMLSSGIVTTSWSPSRSSVSPMGHDLMVSGVMLGTLEGQERVDGRDGCRVCGRNPNLGAAWTIGSLIGDLAGASRHDRGTWHYAGMHLERPGKVSNSKRRRDVAHVVSDRDDPGGVREIVSVKDDAATILKVLKNMGRRVFIHAHDRLTACLHGRERTVRLVSDGFAPALALRDSDHQGEGRDRRGVVSCHGWLGGAGAASCYGT